LPGLERRRRSGGTRALDDLVRALFEKHGRPPGLPEDGVENAAIELIGDRTLHEWFQRAVYSTQELQLEEALSGVGIQTMMAPASGVDDKGGAEAEAEEAPVADARPRGWL